MITQDNIHLLTNLLIVLVKLNITEVNDSTRMVNEFVLQYIMDMCHEAGID